MLVGGIGLSATQRDHCVGSGERHNSMTVCRQRLQRRVGIILADRIMAGGRMVQIHCLIVMMRRCQMVRRYLLELMHGVPLFTQNAIP